MSKHARTAGLLAALAALALPAAARAGITEFDIEPGKAANHAPNSIVAGPDGNLWYADAGVAKAVGRISPAGERFASISTGTGTPWDVALRPDGTMVATTDAGVLLRTPAGTATTIESEPGFGIVLRSDGSFVWGSTPAAAAASTASVCEQALSGTPGCAGGHGQSWVDDVALGPDGLVWSVSSQANVVTRARPDLLGDLTITLPPDSGPTRIAAGPDGNLWVAMALANAIDRITPAGDRTRFALPAGTGPEDVATGPDGALWITGRDNGTILRMTTAGVVTKTYTIPTPASEPTGITAGPDGALWFAEYGSGKIGRLTLDASTPGGANPGGGGPGGGTSTDTTAPRLRNLTITPGRVRRRATAELSFSLSEAADIRVAIQRSRRGRRINGRCVQSTRRNRTRRACTRWVTVRSLQDDGRQGANELEIRSRGLAPGRYRAVLTATDTAANTSRPVTVTFTVLARR